ncbi:MAG: chemotaxis protein CheW [Phycisphaerales bacterium]|nr:chemotaxis protein CheW [Phycisphaerales bacterium]
MTSTAIASDKWVVFQIAGQLFAIEVNHVREMTTMRERRIVVLPRCSNGAVGVLKLREQVVPVVDVRTLLGMPSMAQETEEYVQLLHDREQDHVNWLHELEKCVIDGREFKLTTDPHKCKFGKWFDGLMAEPNAILRIANGDRMLERLLRESLRKLDHPHQVIHSIGSTVGKLLAEGKSSEANEVIEQTRSNELAQMVQLFGEVRKMILELRHPVVMILDVAGNSYGALVDCLDVVREIPDAEIDRGQKDNFPHGLVVGFARGNDESSDQITTLLDIEALMARVRGSQLVEQAQQMAETMQ